MQVYKTTSKIEVALQEVEALMQKHGLIINTSSYGIEVSCGDQRGRLVDTEMSLSQVTNLPRFTDGERIVQFE